MNVVSRDITIDAPVSKVYQLWSNFENFPYFMNNIKQVQVTGPQLSHWVMEGPLGKELEWDARTTARDENTRIAWTSTGGDVETEGQVQFKEIGGGKTRVTLSMVYNPPAGKVGDLGAKLFDNPERKLDEDLENFRHFAEQHRFD